MSKPFLKAFLGHVEALETLHKRLFGHLEAFGTFPEGLLRALWEALESFLEGLRKASGSLGNSFGRASKRMWNLQALFPENVQKAVSLYVTYLSLCVYIYIYIYFLCPCTYLQT